MIELRGFEIMEVNGGGVDPSVLDVFNPKNIYNSAKDFAYDVKKIVTGKDTEINDFAKGFVDGIKSAVRF